MGDRGVGPKDRILDVYGSFARSTGGWIAVGDLIVLLGDVGLDPQAVRAATSRLKRSGVLMGEHRDGRAGYALGDVGRAILEEGDRRIFEMPGTAQAGRWVIVLFSVPESQRSRRYLIRSRLARLGFVAGPSGSWVAPEVVFDEAQRMVTGAGLDAYVDFFVGEFRGEPDLVERWDLSSIRADYEAYLAEFGPLAARWRTHPGSDRDAVVHHMGNIAAWRPLPYADPGLGSYLAPRPWPGETARAVFTELDAVLRPPARRHYLACVNPVRT